ncbi:MAG: LutB/LldF family L-lactate oxidation iron-sulfur protein [Peptococcaceae bacterium]|nr:LutB/LldF family L-lactate oxidation iron-sulfur protein [Peptococcaceae bacterium]
MTAPNNAQFKRRIKNALQDQNMRQAVKKATAILRNNRLKAAEERGNWNAWRALGKDIREHVIANLDYYLQEFAGNVRRNGGQVHFADSANDVIQTVSQVVTAHQAKIMVKSKSMVSEEVHLNKALQDSGVTVVETDLAEYIIQLADEPPSHIIVPAIHKNRYQIAELFSHVAGEVIPADTPSLNSFARRMLRERFLAADVGLSGCNFAVAETGSIALVTNEGNGRMVTSLPKVHIVLMGMERIVPSLSDLEVVLNLLPRSATGQKLTSYVSLITGPHQQGELDGPEELHVIIVDNGRTNLLVDPEFRSALHCIRCGACFNVCPVYRQIGGFAYGSVYGGPIGSVITPLLNDDLQHWGELAYASTLCAACSEACPVMIPLHEHLVRLRYRRCKAGYTPELERMAFRTWGSLFSRPGKYRWAMQSGYFLQRPLMHGNHLEGGPTPLAGWTNSRYFPAVAKEPFRKRWDKLVKEVQD